jgi:hypothetical protein
MEDGFAVNCELLLLRIANTNSKATEIRAIGQKSALLDFGCIPELFTNYEQHDSKGDRTSTNTGSSIYAATRSPSLSYRYSNQAPSSPIVHPG